MVFRPTTVGLEGMGMVFGIGRKDARDEQQPPGNGQVPYKLASYEHDHEGKRFKSTNVVYSFWSASKYVLILSLMLWWLPMFGQMIAGYVGGRRAGGPWKGVIAAIVPVVCLYGVMTGFDSGILPSHVFGVAIAPAAMSAALSTNVPFISPYIQFSSDYVGSFVNGLAGSSPYGINLYVITVAFAYVGGVLAEQNRRELEFSSGSVMSTTTVIAYDGSQQMQQTPQHRGLAHAISGHLPWGRHQDVYAPQPQAAHARRHGEWSGAVDMTYRDSSRQSAQAPMLPAGDDMPEGFSRAYAQKRQKRSHPVPVHQAQRQNPSWIRSDRRVKQTFSSARRFAEDDHHVERAPPQQPQRQHTVFHAQHPHSYVSGDSKSINKAKREIEREWHDSKTPDIRMHDVDSKPVGEAAVAQQPEAKREHHSTGSHWDTI